MLNEPITIGEVIRQGGIAAFCIILWWLERRERIKLTEKLDDCIDRHSRGVVLDDNLPR